MGRQSPKGHFGRWKSGVEVAFLFSWYVVGREKLVSTRRGVSYGGETKLSRRGLWGLPSKRGRERFEGNLRGPLALMCGGLGGILSVSSIKG